ncbi:MAG: hypothetical protein JSV80_07420 [Acidobacteriota bacterium]|nr:MAG: hypothetical protein JSV80_07420 [Acidobacteriota bacterium]
MTGLLVLTVTILVSAIVVKIGSVALRMTGLDVRTAGFQSLSAYSGTGFTTSESEKIVSHPRRRQIVRVLIILGNAGLATVIVSTISTFGSGTTPANMLKVVAIASIAVLLYRVAVARRLNRWLDHWIEKRLGRYTDLELLDFEKIHGLDRHHGIASAEIRPDNPVIDRRVDALQLTERDVLVLAIQRGHELLRAVRPETTIHLGDQLFCYGNLDQIRALAGGEFEPPPPTKSSYGELLSLGADFSISSLSVSTDSPLAGKRLSELELTRRKVLVLARRRDEQFEPAPHAGTLIERGDTLICYGPEVELRDLATTPGPDADL